MGTALFVVAAVAASDNAKPPSGLIVLTPLDTWSEKIVPGTTTEIVVLVENWGGGDIEGISLTVTAPAGIVARVVPATLAELPAGAEYRARIELTAEPRLVEEEVTVAIVASTTDDATTEYLYVTAAPRPSLWPLVGGGLGLLAVSAFWLVFARLQTTGRRNDD